MTKPWTERYTPQKSSDIVGQALAISQLKQAITRKHPALIYGPPGNGKTSSVYAIAADLSFEVLEVNASDFRNTEGVNTLIGGSLHQASLFNKGKIILVDEIDGIAGTEDRGGVQALHKLLADTPHAVVMVANNPWNSKFSTLRKASTLIEFRPLLAEIIFSHLAKICANENITASEQVLQKLARQSQGDLRSAINDLQAIATGKQKLHIEDLNVLGERDKETSMFRALQLIFKSDDARKTLNAFENASEDYDGAFLWLDENIPLEYKGKNLSRAYNALSMADVFRGRIRRQQHWRFLVYINQFLTAGIATAQQHPTPFFVPYKKTSRILKIWMMNQKNAKRKAIAQTLKTHLHSSTKDIVKNVIPYLKIMYQHNMQLDLPLAEEHIQWLTKS